MTKSHFERTEREQKLRRLLLSSSVSEALSLLGTEKFGDDQRRAIERGIRFLKLAMQYGDRVLTVDGDLGFTSLDAYCGVVEAYPVTTDAEIGEKLTEWISAMESGKPDDIGEVKEFFDSLISVSRDMPRYF